MKTVLGIDTSTLSASVAIVRGDDTRFEVLARGESGVSTHSQRLIDLVDEGLRASSLGLGDLDGIAIGAGPGSFTGLRIGMATAKGLAFATGKPLWAVSSLAALALALDMDRDRDRDGHGDLAGRTLIVPVLDARRSEIFAGFYRVERGAVAAVADEQVLLPENLGDLVRAVLGSSGCERAVVLGDGIDAYPDVLGRSLLGVADVARDAARVPPGAAVARLVLRGEHPDVLARGAPTYIRLSEAEIKFPHGNPGGTFSSRE